MRKCLYHYKNVELKYAAEILVTLHIEPKYVTEMLVTLYVELKYVTGINYTQLKSCVTLIIDAIVHDIVRLAYSRNIQHAKEMYFSLRVM